MDYWLICHDCHRRHPVRAKTHVGLMNAASDWHEKHRGHRIEARRAFPLLERISDYLRRPFAYLGYVGNADVKEAFQTEQSFTTTNLQSLATSTTAGWTSASVDNTANLYLDALVQVVIPAVSTAPANNQAIYVYAYGGSNSTDLTTTGAASGGAPGTEGSLTFPSITTPLPVGLPLIGFIPYPVQNAKLVSPEFSVAAAFKGILPPFWGVAILNYSGMTLASSGNTVKYRGVYSTVV